MQDMHRLAERCILAGLSKGGLVQGDIDAAVEADVGALFMPHGAMTHIQYQRTGLKIWPTLNSIVCT